MKHWFIEVKVFIVRNKNDVIYFNNAMFLLITLGMYWPEREGNFLEKIVTITKLVS